MFTVGEKKSVILFQYTGCAFASHQRHLESLQRSEAFHSFLSKLLLHSRHVAMPPSMDIFTTGYPEPMHDS